MVIRELKTRESYEPPPPTHTQHPEYNYSLPLSTVYSTLDLLIIRIACINTHRALCISDSLSTARRTGSGWDLVDIFPVPVWALHALGADLSTIVAVSTIPDQHSFLLATFVAEFRYWTLTFAARTGSGVATLYG